MRHFEEHFVALRCHRAEYQCFVAFYSSDLISLHLVQLHGGQLWSNQLFVQVLENLCANVTIILAHG